MNKQDTTELDSNYKIQRVLGNENESITKRKLDYQNISENDDNTNMFNLNYNILEESKEDEIINVDITTNLKHEDESQDNLYSSKSPARSKNFKKSENYSKGTSKRQAEKDRKKTPPSYYKDSDYSDEERDSNRNSSEERSKDTYLKFDEIVTDGETLNFLHKNFEDVQTSIDIKDF